MNSINRRNFLKYAGTGIAALSVLSCSMKKSSISKPNIIFILADDLGYGDLSCYGQEKFKTPNIDRLAAEGMRFTQHYSGSTVCAPSRCCLMTGKHTGHSFIRGNKRVEPEGQYPIPEQTVTISKLLQQAGYRTGMFGKWGLGGPGSSGDPMKQGFDEFFGYNCQKHAHNYYPDYLWHNTEKVELDGKTYAHDLIMEHAADFIKTNSKNPFFCYLPVTIPHASLHVPEESSQPFREKFKEFEDQVGRYAGPDIYNPPACFAGMVTRLDAQIGSLLNLLEESGIAQNTLVIFTSDNGPHKEGGHSPEFFNSNGPLRGIKRDLYEGGIRVPMIARWPGKIKAGETSDLISAFWDFLPTFTEIAQNKAPDDIDGISLLPAFFDEPQKQQQHKYLYWEFMEQGKQALRMGKWKAVRLNVRKNRNAPIQLFDLDKDIGETTDIAKQNSDVVAKMKLLFVEARNESKEFPLFK